MWNGLSSASAGVSRVGVGARRVNPMYLYLPAVGNRRQSHFRHMGEPAKVGEALDRRPGDGRAR